MTDDCVNLASPLEPAFTHRVKWVGLSDQAPIRVFAYDFTQDDCADDDVGGHRELIEQRGWFQHVRCRNRVTPPHDQEFYEVTLHLRGEAIHMAEDYERPIGPGTVLLVTPGMLHGYRYYAPGAKTFTYNVYFIPEWLLGELRPYWRDEGFVPLFFSRLLFRKPLHASVPQFTPGKDVLDRCLRDIEDIVEESCGPRPSLVFIKSTFIRVLIRLTRAYAESAGAAALLPFPEEVVLTLECVERAIQTQDAFQVADMAKQAGLSKEHFSRVFKDATGWSPMDYYQHRRIQRSCHLLLASKANVTEIAQEAGYCDAAHFCHMFRRFQGMSPTDYRRKYRHAPTNALGMFADKAPPDVPTP